MKKIYKLFLVLLLMATTQGAMAQVQSRHLASTDNGVELWGVMANSNTAATGYGVRTIAADNAALATLAQWDGTKLANGGGVFYDGELHFVNYSSFLRYYFVTTYAFSTADWFMTDSVRVETESDIDAIAITVTHNPQDGKNYGVFYNASATGFELATYDYAAHKKTTIADLSEPLLALATAADGKMYGMNRDGQLVEVKTTGDVEVIGRTKLLPLTVIGDYNRQAMAFHPTTGALYWAAALDDGTTALYVIDDVDAPAKVRKVADFANGEMFSILYFNEAKAAAPQSPTALTAVFDGAATTGSLTFTMPVTAVDGSTLAGELTYKVSLNGKTVATGHGNAGKQVTVGHLTADEGMANIAVTVANSAGQSDKAWTHRWVGYDVPKTPANVVLSIDVATGEATLTWDAVTEGEHDGYIDVDNLTYTITRQPGETATADIKATTFKETLAKTDTPVSYSYTVQAVNHEQKSKLAQSNTYPLGNLLEPPYLETFETTEGFSGYTVISLRGLSLSWSKPDNWLMPYVRSYWDATTDADDWLITPGIYLKAGNTYTFGFDARNEPYGYANSHDPNRFETAWGTAPTAAAMTQLLTDGVVTLDTADWTSFAYEVTPQADGICYFGIHDVSEKFKYYMNVTNISVTEKQADGISTVATLPVAHTSTQAVYNLAGQRVDGSYKGIVIVNGKKMKQ